MAQKKTEKRDPMRELVRLCSEATRLHRQASQCLKERALLLTSDVAVLLSMMTLPGWEVAIKLTHDRSDKPSVSVYRVDDGSFHPTPLANVVLRSGSIIRGRLSKGPGVCNDFFVVADYQGPSQKMGGFRGCFCRIGSRFIASINGIPFYLGAYR